MRFSINFGESLGTMLSKVGSGDSRALDVEGQSKYRRKYCYTSVFASPHFMLAKCIRRLTA